MHLSASPTLRLSALLVAASILLAPHANAFEVWINCGGPEVTAENITYAADTPYTPGGFGYDGGGPWNNSTFGDVGGVKATEFPVYESGRRGFTAYRIDATNGDYVLTLGFNETEFHGPGFRQFDIVVEGDTLRHDLDIAAEISPWYALILRWHVQLADGTLDIELPSATTGDLSVVGLIDHQPDATPPPTPSSLLARGSYDRNLLSWGSNAAADFEGINVYEIPTGGGAGTLLTPDPVPVRRFIDEDVVIGEATTYEVTAVDVFGNESAPLVVNATALPITSSNLDIVELEIDPADIYTLNTNVFNDIFVPATFTVDGGTYACEARYRGSLGRLAPKKSYRVKLPLLVGARDRFNINAEFPDAWLIRNKFGFDLFEGFAPVPNVEFVHLRFNDEFAGVYSDVENLDEHFLTRVGLDDQSSLYKATGSGGSMFLLSTIEEYENTYEKKTGPVGHDDLIYLIEFLNLSPTVAFEDSVQHIVDIDKFVDYYSVIIASSRIGFVRNNYYLYHDLETGLWQLLPWDNSSIFGNPDDPLDHGTFESPTFEGANRLIDRLMNMTAVSYAHAQHLLAFMDDRLNLGWVSPRVNALHDSLLFDAERDFWKYRRESIFTYNTMVPQFEDFVTERRAYISANVYNLMPLLGNSGVLYINELQALNQSTVMDEMGEFEDWIEIYNDSPVTLNLGGMFLTDSAAEPTQWEFPDTLLAPGEFLVVWTDNEPGDGPLHTNFDLPETGGTVYLYDVVPNGNAVIDSLSYPTLAADEAWARVPDGGPPLLTGTPSPGISNEPALNSAPRILELTWSPEIPEETEPVLVTCRVVDDHTVTSVELWVDTGGGFSSFVMADDGQSGDGEAGDGVFGAGIDGQPLDTLVRFYVEAVDDSTSTTVEPETAPAAYLAYVSGYVAPPLKINEVLASNQTINQDEAGDFGDWLEIYNAGGETLDLTGMFLSDNFDDRQKWAFPDTSIAAGEFLLVWSDAEPTEGPLHTTFKLDADGEELALYDSALRGFSRIDTLSWGPQTTDISIGREPDGGPLIRPYLVPTPAASNGDFQPPPVISDVRSTPEFPDELEQPVITCKVTDESGVSQVTLRFDAGSGFTSTPMFDDGLHGDGNAGDGVYGESLPGFAASVVIRYYVEAVDDSAAVTLSPPTAPAALYGVIFGYERPPIYLNEFMAENDTTLADEIGQFEDWIELYNDSSNPIDLSGMYLTDDLQRPTRWAFPDTTIPGGAFFLVWADRDSTEGPLHTNFSLERNGELIALIDSEANGWARIDSVSFGLQTADVSLGLDIDAGSTWIPYAEPTPGAPNLSIIGVAPVAAPAPRLWLGRAYPNPLSSATTIPFVLPASAGVELSVYNVRGALVQKLVDGRLQGGSYQATWDGHDSRGARAASGIYFVELRVDGDGATLRRTNRIVLLR